MLLFAGCDDIALRDGDQLACLQSKLFALHKQLASDDSVFARLHACGHRERLRGIDLVHQRFCADAELLWSDNAGPRFSILSGITAALGQCGVGIGDELWQFSEALLVLRIRQVDNRLRVLHITIHGTLRGVSEVGGHRIEVLLRDRVKLVVVAGGAVRREAQPDPGSRRHAVIGIHRQIFVSDGATLGGGDVAAMEARGDQLLARWVWQQIARDLLHRESIKAHVLIEGTDHPIAIRPHLAVCVMMNPMRVAIACRIQPVASTVLAPLL